MTRYSKPKSIQLLLKSTPFSKNLKTKQNHSLLQQHIASLVPENLCQNYRIHAPKDGILRIDVANAMERYAFLAQQSSLLPCAQRLYPQVSKILFYIDPKLMPSRP